MNRGGASDLCRRPEGCIRWELVEALHTGGDVPLGALENKLRELAERYQMSLAKLPQDALLTYETNVTAGCQSGTALAEWKAQQTLETPEA